MVDSMQIPDKVRRFRGIFVALMPSPDIYLLVM